MQPFHLLWYYLDQDPSPGHLEQDRGFQDRGSSLDTAVARAGVSVFSQLSEMGTSPWKELSQAVAILLRRCWSLLGVQSASDNSPHWTDEFEDWCLLCLHPDGENALGLPTPLALCSGLSLGYWPEWSDWVQNAVTGCAVAHIACKLSWEHSSLSLYSQEPSDADVEWGLICCQCFHRFSAGRTPRKEYEDRCIVQVGLFVFPTSLFHSSCNAVVLKTINANFTCILIIHF